MDQALIQRAFSAFLKTDGIAAEQPNSKSSVEAIGDLKYVVLRNDRRIVAVYRLHNSGLLRRKRRWPLALNGMGSASVRERVAPPQVEAAP